MFPELVFQLKSSSVGAGSTTSDQAKGEFFLVTESHDAEGSFLIHHFLSKLLKDGGKVVFLGLSQSFSHYNAVAQKLGLNLQAAKTSGQLVYVSGLSFSQPFMKGDVTENTGGNSVLLNCISHGSMQPLYNLLKEHLCGGAYPEAHLIIDDITILYSLGVDTKEIFNFIQYCQVYLSQEQETPGNMVALLHCDTNQEEEDDDVVLLSNRLQHACTCHLRVEGLPSGFCKDVHGQMTIIRRSRQESRVSKKMLQFKITDKNVSFFAAGTSSAVL